MGALRALEAVARLGSVNRAASEIGLTRSAVSHQLRFLEEQLGFAITAKAGRGIQLTPRGEIYARDVRRALLLLAEAQGRSGESGLTGKLRVSCAPGFGTFWLCAHIGEFRASYPFLKLEIVTPRRFDDVTERGVDVFIAFGDGDWAGRWVEPLVDLRFSPVCSPALLNAAGGLNSVDDVARLPLLHLSDTGDWSRWIAVARAEGIDAGSGIVFSDMHLLIAAALAGQGIAMGDPITAGDALDEGRLVRPFAATIRSPNSYYLVTDRKRAASAPIQAFRDWMRGRLGRVPDWT
jgi:LysR family glycine cleavage system transcriptional activator